MRLRTSLTVLACAGVALMTTACNLSGQPPTATSEPTSAATVTPDITATPTIPPPTETPAATATPAFAVAPFDPSPNAALPRSLASGAGSNLYAAPGNTGAVYFAISPANPDDYAFIDAFGTLTVVRGGNRTGLPQPFTDFAAASRETSDKLAIGAIWSPDGASLAVLIDNPDRRDANEGVWVWTLDQGINQVLRNCRPGTSNCGNFVIPDGEPGFWYVTGATWSPDGQKLLVRAFMDGYGYDGFMLVNRTTDPNRRPAFCPYEFSEWTLDGSRVVVSGRDANAEDTLGTVIPETCGDFLPAPVADQNLIILGGTQAADGRLVMLGRKGSTFAPAKLYDQDGNALTPAIGTSQPAKWAWNMARDAIWVLNPDGRNYIAGIDGSVTELATIDVNAPVSWGE